MFRLRHSAAAAAAAAPYLAPGLQVFDTNAGFFSPEEYTRFGVPFMKQIAEVRVPLAVTAAKCR